MSDFFTILLILAAILLLGWVVFYFYNKKQSQSIIYRGDDGKFYKRLVCKKGLRYYFFLFRWFLIGKYHCEFKHSYTKKVFEFINHALWGFIIFSCVLTSAALIEWVFG